MMPFGKKDKPNTDDKFLALPEGEKPPFGPPDAVRDAVPPPEQAAPTMTIGQVLARDAFAAPTPASAAATAATTSGRRTRSDKGKARPAKAAATPAAAAGDVLAQVLERIRGAQAEFLEAGGVQITPDPGSYTAERRGHLLLEEALVIGEGRDLVEWLRSKVFPSGTGTGDGPGAKVGA